MKGNVLPKLASQINFFLEQDKCKKRNICLSNLIHFYASSFAISKLKLLVMN
jgi:hypothetical protein